MTGTYTAVEVSAPGMLQVVERRSRACGRSGSDSRGGMRNLSHRCGHGHRHVPGSDAAARSWARSRGRIDALGSGVRKWKVGQRVGVGFFGGEDGVCEPCRRGDIVNCQNPVIPGVTVDGGYAEVMIAEARGIASIPDELTSAEAAPLLCAGITTYNALRNAGLRGGDLVAVQGIGGLGHLGIQFARHMGFRTVAIGRGREKEKLAKIWARTSTSILPSRMPRRCCSAWAGPEQFSQRPPVGAPWDRWCPALAARGKLIVVGVPAGPDSIECVPARLWRALDLRLTDRHGDRHRGHPGLQRSGEYSPDDRDASSRTGR